MTAEISLVIPTYKEDAYIGPALKLLPFQTVFPKMEIIIADYDPEYTGGTIRAVKNLDKNIRDRVKIVNVTKSGIGYARHMGILQAEGKYIVNFDADSHFHDQNDIELLVKGLSTKNYNNMDDNWVDVKVTHCQVTISNYELQNVEAAKYNTLYALRNAVLSLYRFPIAYEQGMTLEKSTYVKAGGFRDVRELEGPLLCTDITVLYGIYSLKLIPEVVVMTSARRGVGSNSLFFDANYSHAYR